VIVGSHLPQYGRASGPEAMRRAAQHAEALGFAGVWASDHVAHPASQTYPSPHLYDPLLSLTWAAASTTTIGLGTSVLVVPQHHPLELANQLASLDALSGGRLTLGVGVGWSEAEFDALGQDFHTRGARTDEIIPLLRACWRDDPATFHGTHYTVDEMRVLPHPAHDIAIWVGGTSERAFKRAVELGDGFHAIGFTPEATVPVVERIRRERPEPEFTISIRTGWDPLGMEHDTIRRELDAWEEAGVQYVVSAPWRTDLDSWLRSMEQLAELTHLTPN
jgi:probable F420-dependent oxidoreductase